MSGVFEERATQREDNRWNVCVARSVSQLPLRLLGCLSATDRRRWSRSKLSPE